MSAQESAGEPPACVCGGTAWRGIPDSLAMRCEACGRVLVDAGDGSGFKSGASLREWAADLTAARQLKAWLKTPESAAPVPDFVERDLEKPFEVDLSEWAAVELSPDFAERTIRALDERRTREAEAEGAALHMWTHDGDDFVIAASPKDADAAMAEYGGSVVDPIEWRQLPDDQPLAADLDDGNGFVKKTCAAWVRERGRGYFCTANY